MGGRGCGSSDEIMLAMSVGQGGGAALVERSGDLAEWGRLD